MDNGRRHRRRRVAALAAVAALALTAATTATAGPTLPLVVCRTGYGVPTSKLALPQTSRLAVPAAGVVALAIYTDSRGSLKIVAPRGWRCSAQYGADGTGGVRVFPSGSSASSRNEGIAGQETSVCVSCTLGQACPLFPAAAKAFHADGFGGCTPAPARQHDVSLRSTVVAFEDPPGVHGTGSPSGGTNPANGVVTYIPKNDRASFLETCTLPTAEHTVCTTVLDDFLKRYGDD